MKKIMIIAWRWKMNQIKELNPEFIETESYAYGCFCTNADSSGKLICISKKNSSKENILDFIKTILKKEDTEYLVLLHKNEPDYYDDNDKSELEKINIHTHVYLFGGDNEELHFDEESKKNFGITDLDTASLHESAIDNNQIKIENYDYVWDFYTHKKKVKNELNRLFYLFFPIALVCKGMLELVCEEKISMAEEYYIKEFDKNPLSQKLTNVLKNIDIDEKSVFLNNLIPDSYKILTFNNIDKDLLEKFLDWFILFKEELENQVEA